MIFEKDYAHIRTTPLDIERYTEAVKLFEGTHCFRNFVTIDKNAVDPKGYIRTIFETSVKVESEEKSLLYRESKPKFIYTHIKGRSFLWH